MARRKEEAKGDSGDERDTDRVVAEEIAALWKTAGCDTVRVAMVAAMVRDVEAADELFDVSPAKGQRGEAFNEVFYDDQRTCRDFAIVDRGGGRVRFEIGGRTVPGVGRFGRGVVEEELKMQLRLATARIGLLVREKREVREVEDKLKEALEELAQLRKESKSWSKARKRSAEKVADALKIVIRVDEVASSVADLEIVLRGVLQELNCDDVMKRIEAATSASGEAGAYAASERGKVKSSDAAAASGATAAETDDDGKRTTGKVKKKRGRKPKHGRYAATELSVHAAALALAPLTCPCGRAFRDYLPFTGHRRQCKVESDLYICSVCFCTVARESEATHWELHENNLALSSPVECPICAASVSTLLLLNDHLADEHPEQMQSRLCCLQCRKVFAAAVICDHWRTKHRCAELLCPHCGKVFTLWNSYATHLLDHEGVRRRITVCCETCGLGFSNERSLQSHRASKHGEEKAFGCDVCSKKFSLASQLKRHKILHADLKPFLCPHCPYASGRKSNVKLHAQKTHRLEDFSYSDVVIDEDAMAEYKAMFPQAETRAKARTSD